MDHRVDAALHRRRRVGAGLDANDAATGVETVGARNVVHQHAAAGAHRQGRAFGHRVGVAMCGRNVVDDVDGQRAVIVVAVHVRNADREAVGVVDAVSRAVRQRIGVPDRACIRIVAGDRDEAVVAVEGLTDGSRNRDATDGHRRRCITRGEIDGSTRDFGLVAFVVRIVVGDFARACRQAVVWRQSLFIDHSPGALARNIDSRLMIGIGDRQGRLRRVAVAIRKCVREDVDRAARRVFVQGVAVAAVRVERQLAELAIDDEPSARIAVGVPGDVVARGAGYFGAVGTLGVRSRRTRGRIRAGDDIAGRDMSCVVRRIGVGPRSRNVVDNVDRQRVGVGVAVGVSQHDREILEQRVFAVGIRMSLVVEQRIGVRDLAGRRVIAGEGQCVAQRRVDMRTDLEYAVNDYVDAADRQAGDAVRRRNVETAGDRGRFLARVRAVLQIVFVDDHVAAIRLGRQIRDLDRAIGVVDGQRRGVRIAVAVGQRVREDVGRTARRAFVQHIAVAAVRVHGQRAELAVDDEAAGGVAIGMTRHIVARQAGHVRVVRAHRVGPAVGRSNGGDDIARGRPSLDVDRVGVVVGGRGIIDDVDGQRGRRDVAVAVGHNHREIVVMAVAARIRVVRDRVGIADLAVGEIDAGDGEDAELTLDGLPDAAGRDLHPVDGDAVEAVLGDEYDRPRGALDIGPRVRTLRLSRTVDRPRGKPRFADLVVRGHCAGRIVRSHDDHRRLTIDELADRYEIGRSIAELRRRNEVTQRNARIEWRNIHREIAAAARRVAGRRLRFGIDEQSSHVRGRHGHVADAQVGHEHRAVRDDHVGAVRHVDDEVATDDVDVRHCDARRQVDDARIGGEDLADVDRQRARGVRALRVGQRVLKDVTNAVGRARIAHVIVIALRIHRQNAVLAAGLKIAAAAAARATGAMNFDHRCAAGAWGVGTGRAGYRSHAADRVSARRTHASRGKRVDIRAGDRPIVSSIRASLRSIIIGHFSPLSSSGPRLPLGSDWNRV